MSNNSKKILICDDEEAVRESLKLILSDHYELILTENSEECMECLKNAPDIGLVLLDIKMPNKNGLEALKEIKSLFPQNKVIIVTGYQSVELLSETTDLGAAGYITKPFESKDLLEIVRKNLA